MTVGVTATTTVAVTPAARGYAAGQQQRGREPALAVGEILRYAGNRNATARTTGLRRNASGGTMSHPRRGSVPCEIQPCRELWWRRQWLSRRSVCLLQLRRANR